ncbi:plasmid mobilization protein [Cellulomonas marina]|uniref:Mobilisation protein (MobC) n=1 Tax=Cellulomonas marina TaxID=988821 RepID=A0A1I0YWB0_9CELL|nr:plasmid mobilization relaxosome protein MobC [Cellulomonas marina]GIG28064.1 hypothetical protein Cma02nite_06640 [Cellulomonas marina]SFB17644.1 mobilisation protein (MobC) [Cellulomonas marina]
MSESTPTLRGFGRRRRANAPGGRAHKHEVKVTAEEEAQLLALAAAQGVTIPRLLVEAALAGPARETSTERRNAFVNLFAIRRLLAAVSNNVNQMAKATNATGQVQAEMTATLAAVRRSAMRLDETMRRMDPA